ncbi:MAG: RNA-binding transcriptional accessory protein [Elusimicrobia bacterium]|nr:RNA-binding transcriptional accessory protein [Elusimicrobiota bacterium]
MNQRYASFIAEELSLPAAGVGAAVALIEQDATIPFIARYRKEATGGLDEVALAAVRDRLAQLKELDTRKEAILKSLEERQLLTDALRAQVVGAATLAKLEDLYLPYWPKKRTRATIAKEKGLEPLAEKIFRQGPEDPAALAAAFVDAGKGVKDAAEALAGARDILAERISEDAPARAKLREIFFAKGAFHSKVITGKEAEGAKFKDYFDWKEPALKAPSHRVLAMRRGEKEGFLYMRVELPEEEAVPALEAMFAKGGGACARQVRQAVEDGYRRLMSFAMETEVRLDTKKKADKDAIAVFARNLREVLMSSPLGHKSVLALDPGFRTGCKLVCLDRQGKLLHHDVIYPHTGEGGRAEAEHKMRRLSAAHKTEVIAIGNGTAGRETEEFVRGLNIPGVVVVMVNESGASVYSASEVAREEFPHEDLTVRGAVSIGRRLMDPLAELCKIDPKAIGVGQYQHDVDQGELKKGLDDTVISCVNAVGVEVNTASKELLSYVSGLGPALAKNIVDYRNENGAFPSRAALKKVPRLGPKAFEQSAGFLRIRDGRDPLDASAVHPERYALVEKMAEDLGCAVKDLLADAGLRAKLDLKKYATADVGEPTLRDILGELAKPGRDPRERFEAFAFGAVSKLEDVKPGMKLPGIVTNVAAFGAFVDIGVHQDGLVHVSELADQFVREPAEVVKVAQRVRVTVLEVDLERRRIALSLKTHPVIGSREARAAAPKPESRPAAARPQARREEAPPSAMAAAFQAMLAKKAGAGPR